MGRSLSIALALALAAPGVGRAAEAVSEPAGRTWIVAVHGGAAVPFPSNHVTSRGVVGLSMTRVAWRRHELTVSVDAGLSSIAKEVTASGRYGLRLSLGRFTFSLGLRVGYVASRVTKGELGSLWTGALVMEPGALVSCRLGRYLELRASLPGVALHWNRLWLARWEPTLGLGIGF